MVCVEVVVNGLGEVNIVLRCVVKAAILIVEDRVVVVVEEIVL